MKTRYIQRRKRHNRVRSRIYGTKDRPRIVVFRSNQHMYAQIVDDTTGRILASERDIKKTKSTKTEHARLVGESLAKKAKTIDITTVVFDRGGYQYHGRVQALAEGLRKGGLTF